MNVITASQLAGCDLGMNVIAKHPNYDKFKHSELVKITHFPGGIKGTIISVLIYLPGGRLTLPGDTSVTVYDDA